MATESESESTENSDVDSDVHSVGTGKAIVGLIVSLVITFGIAAFGSQYMPDEWYEQLNKPSFNPPNWVFGPVWTLLYAMMSVAAWLVWKERGWSAAKLALAAYLFQLVLNSLWTYLFFGRHAIGTALIEMVVLWVAILTTLLMFKRTKPLAGYLLVPYLAWVSFAMLLNFSFWRLNP